MGNKSKLTARQIEFAKHYVEGIYSARQCAIKSGYTEDVARRLLRCLNMIYASLPKNTYNPCHGAPNDI